MKSTYTPPRKRDGGGTLHQRRNGFLHYCATWSFSQHGVCLDESVPNQAGQHLVRKAPGGASRKDPENL